MRVICVACGPSLNAEQIAWVNCQDCIKIAVNNACYVISHPDYVLAADYEWWQVNDPQCGKRVTSNPFITSTVTNFISPIRGSYSSGGRAIEFAALQLGATRIELLGYDCSVVNGSHFHGDHTGTLDNPNRDTTERWLTHYRKIRDYISLNVEILNYSLYTEIPDEIFPRLSRSW